MVQSSCGKCPGRVCLPPCESARSKTSQTTTTRSLARYWRGLPATAVVQGDPFHRQCLFAVNTEKLQVPRPSLSGKPVENRAVVVAPDADEVSVIVAPNAGPSVDPSRCCSVPRGLQPDPAAGTEGSGEGRGTKEARRREQKAKRPNREVQFRRPKKASNWAQGASGLYGAKWA